MKSFPQHPEFNKRLNSIADAVETVALRYANEHDNKYPTPDILKGLLDNTGIRAGKSKARFNVSTFFDEYIRISMDGTRITKKGKPIAASTIKSYNTTKGIIEAYQKYAGVTLEFAGLDIVFYTSFVKYLTTVKKESTNYIGKHITVLKALIEYAREYYNIEVNEAYKSKLFAKTTEKTDSIYLPEHELKEIADLDLSATPTLDKVRDLFLVGCHTGLRFSDLCTLSPKDISKSMINITQIKTGDTIAIPVHPTVNKILRKYGGALPAAISNQKTNEALKDIAKQCKSLQRKFSATFTKGGVTAYKGKPDPKGRERIPERWQLVTTHTARRSFCTNQYLNGIPTITIMAISGHRTESAFMKYIKVAAQEHAHIIKAAWDKQQNEQPKIIAI